MDGELVNVPQDLTLVSDEELATYKSDAENEFNRIHAFEITPERLEYLSKLSDDLERVEAETSVRRQRAESEDARNQRRMKEQADALAARVNGTEPKAEAPTLDIEAITRAAAEGVALAMSNGDFPTGKRSVAAARVHVNEPRVPSTKQVVTAAVDIPGVARGDDLSLDKLVDAFHKQAKGMRTTADGIGNERLVASVKNQYQHTVDDHTSPSQMAELFNVLTSKEQQEALVAGGGWCAPSEIRYDFFNVAGVDGLIDLPSFGVSRGGVRYPISPSLADGLYAPFGVAFSNTSVPWLWTETDDQLTVTGSTNKPTVRVPCPSFEEKRLECYGLTLTAGNLTDDAYPEATRNTLRLLIAAHAHAMNARIISTMETLSTVLVTGGDLATATSPVTNQVLGAVAMAATDYRARYGMTTTDVLEVVYPYWIKEMVRSDIAYRKERDVLSISDAEIQGLFAPRNVRVQFVNDWQVRSTGFPGASTPIDSWPTDVSFLIYAAGTFVKGNGLSLDLGVVRDSVLNAENDHTAAWSEECHLVAKLGHASRKYTMKVLVGPWAGTAIGQADRL